MPWSSLVHSSSHVELFPSHTNTFAPSCGLNLAEPLLANEMQELSLGGVHINIGKKKKISFTPAIPIFHFFLNGSEGVRSILLAS